MCKLPQLCHWVTGQGKSIDVSEFVPQSHPLRQWADVLPWPKFVSAVEESFAGRFPKQRSGGQEFLPLRVLLALELLKAELNCSDEQICARLRTDFAVMYACGIEQVKVDRSQGHYVLPESLCRFRSHIDETLMTDLVAIQVAEAMEEGLVSPQHLVVDTFPSEQGSQRVTDATTLYKAEKSPAGHPTNSPSNSRRYPHQSRSTDPAKGSQSADAHLWQTMSGQGKSLSQMGATGHARL